MKPYPTQSLFLASLLAACAVQAGPIIYDNGAPNFMNAQASDVALAFGGGVQAASDFVLGQDNVVADIHWWGSYTGATGVGVASVDNFTIYIYSDSAGSPGTVAHTIPVGNPGRTAAGSIGGNPAFAYKYDLASPITLTPGVTYWLSILNDTTGDLGGEWWWMDSVSLSGNDQGRLLNNGSPGPWLRASPGGFSSGREFAYNLTGPSSTSVPDRGSALWLLILSLGGLAGLRRQVSSMAG